MSSLKRQRTTRTHRLTVFLELTLPGSAGSRELEATIEFRRTPYRPATHLQPAEGNEIEDTEVVALALLGQTAAQFDNTPVELPQWLADLIRESVSEDALHEAADAELEAEMPDYDGDD